MASAARGLSTYGYANLVLEQVARESGYTRGALYHLFANKEDLTLAVVEWVSETWNAEVRRPALAEVDPLASLLTMARGHVLYCRRDMARVMLTLRVEFAGQDHPVGRAVGDIIDELEAECAKLIAAGRRGGSIPPGPPAHLVAAAFTGVFEAVAIEVAGHAPHDIELMERAVRGVLGVAPIVSPSPASHP
ncbi:TetR/AcrR family transcriptional regulator [Nonomuraea sp. SBT364]|uniref:TetR/AcrR family transcriptional regulator n=1 Tax=Nonomuraea sp. SBT364 TaxID=1580530 RepID=UPI000A653EBB|nr:TetR/AcrR family transcriptional regulator [Nonomuraea sp. SBT364]